MLRQISHLSPRPPRDAEAVKYHDSAGHRTKAVVNGCAGVLCIGLSAIAADQHTVRSQGDNFILAYRDPHGILRRLARPAIDNSKDVLNWKADGIILRPACQPFRD